MRGLRIFGISGSEIFVGRIRAAGLRKSKTRERARRNTKTQMEFARLKPEGFAYSMHTNAGVYRERDVVPIGSRHAETKLFEHFGGTALTVVRGIFTIVGVVRRERD